MFSAPVLFRDRSNAAAALADPELNLAILTLGADKGLVGIGTFAYAQHDYLAKEPIRSFADFKGKKIRVNATPLEREAMARLGATAAPMPLNEVLTALSATSSTAPAAPSRSSSRCGTRTSPSWSRSPTTPCWCRSRP